MHIGLALRTPLGVPKAHWRVHTSGVGAPGYLPDPAAQRSPPRLWLDWRCSMALWHPTQNPRSWNFYNPASACGFARLLRAA